MPQESVENRVNHRKLYVWFVVDQVEVGQDFLRAFWLSHISIILQCPIQFTSSTTDAIYPKINNYQHL